MTTTLMEKMEAVEKININNKVYEIKKIKGLSHWKESFYFLYDVCKLNELAVIEVSEQVYNILIGLKIHCDKVEDNGAGSDGIYVKSNEIVSYYSLEKISYVKFTFSNNGNLVCYIKYKTETTGGITPIDTSLFSYLKYKGINCEDERLYTYYKASRNPAEGILLKDNRYIPYELIKHIEKYQPEDEVYFKLIYIPDFRPTNIALLEVFISKDEAKKLIDRGVQLR